MNKKEYTAPMLTAVVFRAERGYAESGENPMDNLANQINGYTEFVLQNGDVQTWGETGDQGITGYNETGDGNDGLAAGYFGQQDGSSWF